MSINDEMKVLRLIQGNLEKLSDPRARLRVAQYAMWAMQDEVTAAPPPGHVTEADNRQTATPGTEDDFS